MLLVVLILFLWLHAQKESNGVSNDVTTAQEEDPFKEFYEISWLVQYTKDYEEGRWDELELEQKFNIDLKVWNVDYDNAEELTLMVSAGDVRIWVSIRRTPLNCTSRV